MGDNIKSQKASHSCIQHVSRPVQHFCQIPSKYSEGYSSYRTDTKSISKTKGREITWKVRKPELSFLYATGYLIQFYNSTKYHKNIPKGIWLTELTQNQCIITIKYTKSDSAKSKNSCTGQVLSSCSSFLLNTIKIFQGYLSYSADMKAISNKTKGDFFCFVLKWGFTSQSTQGGHNQLT